MIINSEEHFALLCSAPPHLRSSAHSHYCAQHLLTFVRRHIRTTVLSTSSPSFVGTFALLCSAPPHLRSSAHSHYCVQHLLTFVRRHIRTSVFSTSSPSFVGCGTGNRTPIFWFRARRPT